MAKVEVAHIRQKFLTDEQRISGIVDRTANFYEERAGSVRKLYLSDIKLITEICFLRVILSWESFMEDVFARFLCGAKRLAPPQPKPVAIFARIVDAKRVAGGDRGYVNWINPSVTIDTANRYLGNGEPLSMSIRAAYRDLEDIRIVRNRIAHSSPKVELAFSRLVRERYGYNPRGMTPGAYLLDSIPAFTPDTYYIHYSRVLVTVANLIVG